MKHFLLSVAMAGLLALNLNSPQPVQAQAYGEPESITMQDTPVPNVIRALKDKLELVGAQPLSGGDKFLLIGAVNQAQEPILIILYAGRSPGTVSKVTFVKLPPNNPNPTTTL